MQSYRANSDIDLGVELTANHRGYFEFRICQLDNVKAVETDKCFDRYVLQRSDGQGARYSIRFHWPPFVFFSFKKKFCLFVFLFYDSAIGIIPVLATASSGRLTSYQPDSSATVACCSGAISQATTGARAPTAPEWSDADRKRSSAPVRTCASAPIRRQLITRPQPRNLRRLIQQQQLDQSSQTIS